ncbi:MAG: hypothetical protein ACO29O_00645 [Chitinophagaceae bacterium]
MDKSCKTCNNYTKSLASSRYGWMGGILLAILPKCPFCLLAYSSTMVLCGEGTLINSKTIHVSPLTIILTSLLGLLTIIGIYMNRRGQRTTYALLLSLLGLALVFSSVLQGGGEWLYYTGTAIIFVAIWLNGSMLWFVSSIIKILERRKSIHPKF